MATPIAITPYKMPHPFSLPAHDDNAPKEEMQHQNSIAPTLLAQERKRDTHTKISQEKDTEEIGSPHAKMYPNQEMKKSSTSISCIG